MSRAKELLPEISRVRRHLHRYPELSFEERETAAYIGSVLDEIGIPYRAGIGGYGIVGIIAGRNRVPVVALRADIDALPITETTGLEFASERNGVMHACGHDVHTSSLLGAARILWEQREELPGVVKLIFQPAEEKLPGGAQAMIRDGALDNPRPDVIIGQHINPELPAGTVGFRSGVLMASVDDIYITVHGKGGHAAYPHKLRDPVLAASQIVVSLQQLVSRLTRPDTPAVLSFGRLTANGANNVVPDEVRLVGTFRTVDEEYREFARREIERIAEQQAEAFGVTATVEIKHGYPCLSNDPEVTSRLAEAATEALGAERVHELPLSLGGEDFAYYAREMPSCFYNVGVSNFSQTPEPAPLHSSELIIDEASLEVGASFLALAAIEVLKHYTTQSR